MTGITYDQMHELKNRAQNEIELVLETLGIDAKVSIETGGSRKARTIKFEIISKNDDGTFFDPEADAFASAVKWHNTLEPTDYGLEVWLDSNYYKIVGYKSRNRKYPLIMEQARGRNTGKRYKRAIDETARNALTNARQIRDEELQKERDEILQAVLNEELKTGSVY